jgi:imidazolonepropionase
MAAWPVHSNAWLLVIEGRVAALGTGTPPHKLPPGCEMVDLQGALLTPGFCDSHTHAVFAAWRSEEYLLKLQGLSYAEIAARGGGILNSARRLAELSEEELYSLSLRRIHQLMAMGTTALEIKSGYGLDVPNELKMLRVIERLRRTLPIPVQATCLAAHAIPAEYRNRRADYIHLICEELLPAAAAERLADFVDVFCEEGFFSEAETEVILRTASDLGFRLKVHANQLGHSGGVRVGVRLGALSVDHLEYLNDDEVALLAPSRTIATVLPVAAWFLSLPYPPVRKLLGHGAALALATDFNPGSAPSGSMWMALALACTSMKLLPCEALAAATWNGACAMNLQAECGALCPGYRADFIVLHDFKQPEEIPYRFHHPVHFDVYIAGKQFRRPKDSGT